MVELKRILLVEDSPNIDFQEFVDVVKHLGLFWAVVNQPPPDSSTLSSDRRGEE